MKRLLVFLTALSLVFGGLVLTSQSAFAAQKKAKAEKKEKAAKAKAQKVSGTVSSASDTSLVVSHGAGASKTEDTFVLNPSTKKEGALENGAKVTVHYKMEGNDKVATVVKAGPAKAMKAEKKSKKKAG